MALKSLTFCAVALLAAIVVAQAAQQPTFPVHRLLQTSTDSAQFGSQKAAVSMSGSTLDSEDGVAENMLVLPVDSVNLEKMKKILTSDKPGSILFLVPEKELSAESMGEWKAIEEFLVSHTELKIPVWFAMDSAETRGLYASLQSSATENTLVVESPEPVALKKFELSNIQGLLTGLSGGASGSLDDVHADVTKIPTIAITATWDAVASAPGLAIGANSDASGVVALFQIARALSKLYVNSRTQARYNVVFIVSSGTHLNYAGSRYWIDSSATGSAVRESLEWVLCLDSLAHDGELFLHASRPSKDPVAARLYDTFTSVAKSHGVAFSVVQKKINIAETTSSWEHEVFARRKILAVTLSQYASSGDKLGIFDTVKKVNMKAFSKNMLFVLEAITRLIYKQDSKSPAIISSSSCSAVNETLTQGWLNTITAHPRMVPFIDATKHHIVDYVETTLKQFVPDLSRQTFKPDVSDRTFYSAVSATLVSYRTRPFNFDLTLFFIVCAVNAVLYIIVKGDVDATRTDFIGFRLWLVNRFTSAASSSSSSSSQKSKKNQ